MSVSEKCRKWHWEFLFVGLFLMGALLYVLIRGENIYIQVFDNLDSNIAWEKLLKDFGLYFKFDGDVPMLGGVSRNNFSSEWKLYTWLYILLPPFVALVAGWFLRIFMAIAGFMLLGKLIYTNFEEKRGTFLICGFLYGILPTFPTSAFAFASIPLLLWLMIKLYRTADLRWLVLVFFYPVLSSATVFGIFACGYIFVFFAVDWITNKRPAWRMLIAVFVLGFGYIFSEWRLFYSMFFAGVDSIRSTFAPSNISFSDALQSVKFAFLHGQVHCASSHFYLVLPVCGIYFLYINIGYIVRKEYKKILCDVYNWLMIWIGFNCIVYGMDELPAFKALIATALPPLKGFSFARTLWFNPFLWYFSFMIVLCRLPKKGFRLALAVLAMCVVCLYPSEYNEIRPNLTLALCEAKNETFDRLTYREFYSENLFDEIKEDIDYDGEWSVAFGMHPAVLQYNTIATLDGYLSTYPAAYKVQFRKLMAPEFAVDTGYASYFDSWGGRAYVFSDQVDFNPVRNQPVSEADMNIDPDVFRQMGGKYVFSQVEISNAADLGFDVLGVYTHADSPYTVYVYQLQQKEGE